MEAESANLQAQVVDLRKELRREVQKRCRLRREMRKLANATLPPVISHGILIVYVLSDYDVTPACEFLRRYFKQKYAESLPEPELKKLVEDLFLRCNEDELAALTDRADPANREAMRKAEQFLLDYSLHRYVREQNMQKGVAPTTQMVLERKHFNENRHEGAAQQPMSHHAGHTKGRSWAWRWRSRWQVQWKAMRAIEDISVPERRAKVTNGKFLSCHLVGRS